MWCECECVVCVRRKKSGIMFYIMHPMSSTHVVSVSVRVCGVCVGRGEFEYIYVSCFGIIFYIKHPIKGNISPTLRKTRPVNR